MMTLGTRVYECSYDYYPWLSDLYKLYYNDEILTPLD